MSLLEIITTIISVIALFFSGLSLRTSMQRTKYEKKKDQERISDEARDYIGKNKSNIDFWHEHDDYELHLLLFLENDKEFEKLSTSTQMEVEKKLGINLEVKRNWRARFRNWRIAKRVKKITKKKGKK
jgi:hypothetical protein